MPSNDSDWLPSQDDGLRARKSGLYALDKLAFLKDFMPPGLQIATRKLDRWYVDLFAGPGRNIHPDSLREWEGSPILALQAHSMASVATHFTHAVLVNRHREDNAALRERVQRLRTDGLCLIPEPHVEQPIADSNTMIPSIMRKIHKKAYALVVADITAPKQLPWKSVERIKEQGHESVDLYMLFPLEMAINRMLPYDREGVAPNESTLDAFFGSEEWRPIWEARNDGEQSSGRMRQGLLEFYMERLRTHGRWKHVYEVVNAKLRGQQKLYRMLFATDDDAAARVSTWLVDNFVDHTGQQKLQLGDS